MPERPNFDYVLKLNSEHAEVLQNALELWSRIHMGQIEEVAWPLQDMVHTVAYHELKDKLKECCPLVTGLPPNAYFSLTSEKVPETAKMAWEMYAEIRHRTSWDRMPEGGMTVNFDKPMSVTNKPKVKLERVNV